MTNYYLASIDDKGHIVETCRYTNIEDLDNEGYRDCLKMLSEFKTHTPWEDLEERGFCIIKLTVVN